MNINNPEEILHALFDKHSMAASMTEEQLAAHRRYESAAWQFQFAQAFWSQHGEKFEEFKAAGHSLIAAWAKLDNVLTSTAMRNHFHDEVRALLGME